MNIPLIIMAVLTSISLLISANKHGKLENKKHNFWLTLIASIIEWSLILWLVLQ